MERADLEQWKAREVARLLALVETERRYYQEITAAIPVGLLVLSTDFTIVSANPAIRRIFGLSKSPLRARLDSLLPAGLLDRVAEVLKTGSAQIGVLVTEPKSGRHLRIGILAIHSWDDDSSSEALLSIEDLSGVGTAHVPVPSIGGPADLAEQRLLKEQWVQSERAQALSKLAARMAHDLNNMLMLVTGHGEELQNLLPVGSPLRADVQEILNASERMSGLTGHLLAFTRRQPTAVNTVELESVLRGIEAGIRFQLSPQPSVVKADADRLAQFLTSLVERERPITIETSRVEIKEDLRQPAASLRPGVYGVVSITMSGRPFDADAKSGWFEAVLPGKDPSDDWATFITRAYITFRQWGGDIAASAAPGGGTLLRLFLESVPEPGARKPAVIAAGAAARPETILVAEDEPGIRALIEKILRRHGYEVLAAANGEEALAVCREHSGSIALLITDVMMPQMGGAELVERLRAQELSPKVLYISGYTDDPKIYAGKFPPGTAFLAKPFTLASLMDKVREVLQPRS